MGYSHTVIQGASPRQACEAEGVRWVNVVLSNLKRALDGTYHVFCFFKYSHRYLGEAVVGNGPLGQPHRVVELCGWSSHVPDSKGQ